MASYEEWLMQEMMRIDFSAWAHNGYSNQTIPNIDMEGARRKMNENQFSEGRSNLFFSGQTMVKE